jgi:uncharacterized protein
MAAIATEVADFLREPHVASLATVRPDGRPHVTPIWYDFDGREFVVSTLRATQKVTNVGKKGFAAITVSTPTAPYRHVIAEGTARLGSALDNVWRERVASRHLGDAAGRAYAQDTAELDLVSIYVRPMRWSTQGFETS